MISGFGWAALAILVGYLALFFWGSAQAAEAAGKPIWLFGRATGRDRLAAIGFRAAFALAFFGPLLWLVWPMLHKADPLWTEGKGLLLGVIGILLASIGAMIAFAASLLSSGTSSDEVKMLVLMKPGQIAFTRMPYCARSVAATLVRCSTPAFATA